jgi:hypothetical protein
MRHTGTIGTQLQGATSFSPSGHCFLQAHVHVPGSTSIPSGQPILHVGRGTQLQGATSFSPSGHCFLQAHLHVPGSTSIPAGQPIRHVGLPG